MRWPFGQTFTVTLNGARAWAHELSADNGQLPSANFQIRERPTSNAQLTTLKTQPGSAKLDRFRGEGPIHGARPPRRRARAPTFRCAARLRQADRDCLLRGSRSVLPLAHVMNFLAHELAGLSV
jgi:hypothetical protein